MKGFTKAVKRTPFMVTSKVGMSKKSNDPEFDDYQRHFSEMEKASEKFIKDVKSFLDAVNGLFTCGAGYATHFSVVMHPISGEYDLLGKHPEAGHTIRNVDKYETAMEELRASVGPELELIESRITAPAKELQSIMKLIRKSITKRDHKLMDYDRFNNSLTKLRDKKEKSLSDEKNLFKLEQDFEMATNEYEFINNALKTDLPRFMALSTQFIDPLFHSFFYMQLNIFYLILEKMNTFAETAKYDISNVPGQQISDEYEQNRTDAWSQIEELGITKRIISVSKLVQQNRAAGGGPLARNSSTTTTSSYGSTKAPPQYTAPPVSSFKKSPPPSLSAAVVASPPPPYSVASVAATKRAPPPPPPLKPKPAAKPAVQYVVALYDFAAQAEGDLSFNVGDRIEIVERTGSAEDWWTGRLNGQQGVFPGNYVQET
ncbi:BAR-domain-containing protein [Guyanagaster necrorhizus]|uniref:BAR-domain-containing protein n=1 Tax=Guyanagaster necrorhizus TaxID=856835 RepID=A0A9P8AYB6_9AGAR|nr:BAR-domain-containing protein [Guyanagaster necrorhizus MCA 3950]KAG7450757.1 BAR-domain-containing protein [Guyanagaster necrorhizus MCA 3950]